MIKLLFLMEIKEANYTNNYIFPQSFSIIFNSFKDKVEVIKLTYEDNFQNLDFDCVILPGGGKFSKNEQKGSLSQTNYLRYNFEKKLIEHCFENKIPILGICRGFQMINETLGGEICYIKDEETKKKHINNNSHIVSIKKDSFLFEIFKTESLVVNSLHLKEICMLSSNLQIIATSNDNIIEAFQSKFEPKFLGVQWHPELIKNHISIFEYFFNYVEMNKNRKLK